MTIRHGKLTCPLKIAISKGRYIVLQPLNHQFLRDMLAFRGANFSKTIHPKRLCGYEGFCVRRKCQGLLKKQQTHVSQRRSG